MSRPRYREDADLMPEVAAAIIRTPNKWARYTMYAIGLAMVAFLVWASQTRIDEVTSGDGRVIPSRQNQIVQHLEGGIISEIMVREGDIVRPGQVLLRIENSQAESEYGEKRNRYLSLLGRSARLQAEVEGRETIDFPNVVLREGPEIASREQNLFRSRRARLASEIELLEAELRQRRQALREQRSTVETLVASVRSLRRELQRAEALEGSGAISRLELLRLRRETRDKEGELRTERLKIPRAEAAVRETEQRIEEKRRTARAEAQNELVEARRQISMLEEQLEGLHERQTRTEIRSPVRGTVTRLHVNTIGGVVRSGEPLVEIVPLEDSLLVEARIRPSDRAFLHPGQQAMVKITAYEFSVYGGLRGEVVDISADTIEDPNGSGERFYRIRVRTDRNYLLNDGERLPIIPGMTATIDIRTGQKTVLQYIFKPLTKTTVEVERDL